MNLPDFGIANYRSFDEQGVFIKGLKKINVLIGKNNSGKSNVLRFIKRLQEVAKGGSDRVYQLEDQYRRNGQNPLVILEVDSIAFFQHTFILPEKILVKVNLYDMDYWVDTQFLTKYNDMQLIKMQKRFRSAEKRDLVNQIKYEIFEHVKKRIADFFISVQYIPQHRQVISGYEANRGQVEESDFNGNNIIELMFKMQNPDIGHENDRDKFDKIQNFVRELLNDEDLLIEIPNTKDKVVIRMNEVRLPLEYFGAGIHQLVILCSALVIYENTIFCIEEPEVHLHPELQKKFISLLKATNNVYFITTHSNSFIDYDENISIFHVKLFQGRSQINSVSNSLSQHQILDDLGFKNSDILHSNGIIWVEGPSDRVLINKWISLLREDLKEGVHYSILFYGGRLLSNVTYLMDNIDEKLIPLLRINRNAYVVIDKDGKKITDAISATKQRIQDEIGENKCWITAGREIENYLAEENVNIWVKQNYGTDCRFEYSKHEVFETTLNKNLSKMVISYGKDKVKYSREISKFTKESDLDILDLRERIIEIISWIDKWNK